MRIRRATAADYGRAGEVTVAAYADFTLGPTDPYIARLRDAATRDREAELWVATDPVDDAEILGCVTLCPPGSPWRELATGDAEGEFRMLAVAPQAQRRGVGRALIEFCLDHFRGTGCRTVVLSSLRQMSAAHRLYARLGFERDPERDWEPVPGVCLLAFQVGLED